jgi:cellulose synthase/poly-beta-1,6-N-acetylglucosamine synthase-like glycosyltransferase
MGHAHLFSWIILVPTWCLAITWLYKATRALVGMRGIPDLNELDLTKLPALSAGSGPDLTVVVPACNEESSIEDTLDSLLAQQAIRVQIVAIDDRSTDRTGALMEALRSRVSKDSAHTLEVIRNRELPPGWLGKPHAVSLAVARAAAPWILLTDADMNFAPHCLAGAVRLAEARRADHFVLLPTLIRTSWTDSAALAVFQALTQWSMRLWKVEDPKARDFLGVGGFNMIRAETLKAIGGIEAVRLEVVEDVSIGWLVKRQGFRSLVAVGPGQTSLRWFQGTFGLVANLEKNGFAAFRFSLPLVLITLVAMCLQVALPVAAVFLGWPGVAAVVAMHIGIAIGYGANRKVNSISPAFAVLYAPSLALLCWAFARSTILTLRRGGVSWRGTFYPLAELKRGMVPWSPW